MKKTVVILFALIVGGSMYAQQDAMYTHYMFNTLMVNPAYAGSRDVLTVTGLHRSQWVDFPGAPSTQTLTLHTPAFNEQLGLGLSVVNDKIGPTNNTSAYGDVTYRLKVNETTKLGIGVKAGINMMSGDFLNLITDQQGDQAFQQDLKSTIQPNFGFGLYWDAEKYYVGLSSPNLLKNTFDQDNNGEDVTVFEQQQHYFLIAGFVTPLNENIKLLPTGFLKVTEGAPIEGDLTARFLFNEKYWLGAMYRTGDAAGLLAGLNINDQLSAGYSFDFSFLNESFNYNYGSHEIMLRYDFMFKDQENILSPRYF